MLTGLYGIRMAEVAHDKNEVIVKAIWIWSHHSGHHINSNQ